MPVYYYKPWHTYQRASVDFGNGVSIPSTNRETKRKRAAERKRGRNKVKGAVASSAATCKACGEEIAGAGIRHLLCSAR